MNDHSWPLDMVHMGINVYYVVVGIELVTIHPVSKKYSLSTANRIMVTILALVSVAMAVYEYIDKARDQIDTYMDKHLTLALQALFCVLLIVTVWMTNAAASRVMGTLVVMAALVAFSFNVHMLHIRLRAQLRRMRKRNEIENAST